VWAERVTLQLMDAPGFVLSGGQVTRTHTQTETDTCIYYTHDTHLWEVFGMV
jgi:hypothetical protein